MKFPSFYRPGALALGAAFILAACSGGESMVPAATVAATGSTPAISAANAQAVAAQAMFASDGLSSKASSDSTIVAGQALDAASTGVVDAALQQVDKVARGFFNKTLALVDTLSLKCPQGGTANIKVNAKNTQQFAAGDSIVVQASNCDDADKIANGTITINFNEVTGTPSANSAWSAKISLDFNNVSFKQPDMSRSANGKLTLDYNQTAFRVATFSLSSDSLQLSRTAAGTSTAPTLTKMNTSGSVNGATFMYRTSFTVAGNFPQLGQQTLTVTTPTDFVQQAGLDPSQGVLKVTASDGSNLTLTAVSPARVNIGVDLNGDGTVDLTMPTTWDQLAKQITI